MMSKKEEPIKEKAEHLLLGYEKLVERAASTLKALGEKSAPHLHDLLEEAKTKAIELGELTEEESERVVGFISRDLHDAGQYLVDKERNLEDWLRLDLLLIEKKTLHRFSSLAQLARLEVKHIKKDPKHLFEWHTGEITGIGTLTCDSCGQLVHFERAGHIPPCPSCHGTHYHRTKKKK